LRKFTTLVMAAVLGGLIAVGGFVPDAEAARRVGGGKSIGMQREAAPQRPAPPPAREATPAQAQQAPAAAPPMQAAPQRPGMGRWLAPIAGLAAGLGLAALFGEQLGSILAALLVAAAVVFGVVLVMRALGGRRSAAPALQSAGAGAGADARVSHEPIRYSGLGHETVGAPPPQPHDSGPGERPATGTSLPAGFDLDGFLRQAKKSFVALQGANDRGDLETLRDLTTDEMYALLRTDVGARGGVAQQVDVVTLDAELLDVVTEDDQYRASIRFSGLMREEEGGAPTPFEEVWHLQKPVAGGAGWLLAGIQQAA